MLPSVTPAGGAQQRRARPVLTPLADRPHPRHDPHPLRRCPLPRLDAPLVSGGEGAGLRLVPVWDETGRSRSRHPATEDLARGYGRPQELQEALEARSGVQRQLHRGSLGSALACHWVDPLRWMSATTSTRAAQATVSATGSWSSSRRSQLTRAPRCGWQKDQVDPSKRIQQQLQAARLTSLSTTGAAGQVARVSASPKLDMRPECIVLDTIFYRGTGFIEGPD